ncbi:MAG: heparin lyase I family protein [Pseudomonadota bacterium]
MSSFIRPLRSAAIYGFCFTMLFLSALSAEAENREIVIDGKAFAVEARSVKCDVGEIDGVSTKRLLGCDSAERIEYTVDGEKQSAILFRLNPDDAKISDGVRAELRDMHEAKNGEETWYRFATLLPEDFPVDAPHRLVLSQWHERVQEGVDSLRPPLSHRLWNGRFVVTLWNQERLDEKGIEGDGAILFEKPQLERDVFHEFVYKIAWSDGDNGQILGWMRQCRALDADCPSGAWDRFLTYQGQTGYASEKIIGYYFKLGLYTVTSFDAVFTAYHRGYRRGASAAEIGLTETALP